MLTSAEDSLIEYNIEHRIINYGEQTKQVAGMDASYQMMDNDLLITYSTSKALIDFMNINWEILPKQSVLTTYS